MSSGADWGGRHIQNLVRFLKDHTGPHTRAANEWPAAWAAYYPIGSELNLLCHTSMEQCWLPHTASQGQLTWYRWQADIDSWNKDQRGLPIPPDAHAQCASLSDANTPRIVITPCLAADLSGVRLGYGGGYYDRLLAASGSDILTVACVPDALLLEANTLPRQGHDMPVDVLVTEHNTVLLAPEKLKRVLG